MNAALEILAAIKDRLLTKGWSPGLGRCLYMTIEAVVDDDLWYGTRPQDKVIAVLREVVGDQSLAAWNTRQTSIDAVLAAVEKAVEMIASEGAP